MTTYNEIYDDAGTKRPAYAALEARTRVNVTEPPAQLAEALARRGIVGREGIHPIPLVIDQDEYSDVLVPGVLQRAFALQELFADIALGSGEIVRSGLLSEEDLRNILLSEGIDYQSLRRLWQGQGLDQITFVYGPDLVRDQHGCWIVLEDNIGCVGGVGDGRAILDTYLAATGIQAYPDLPRVSDLEQAIRTFLCRVGVAPGGDGVFGIPGTAALGSDSVYDYETSLKSGVLQSIGVVVTQPSELFERLANGSVYLSALINLSATLTREYRRLASLLFQKRGIPLFGAPCVGLVASKSFHALGGALASLYLHEEFLLTTPHTRLLRDVPTTLPRRGVLKRSSGCEGAEVFFLDEIVDNNARCALLKSVSDWGRCGAVIQERKARSVLKPAHTPPALAASVEVRPIAYVLGWRTAVVGAVVTARAVCCGGEPRGNISRGAQFLPLLREVVTPNRNVRSAQSP